MNLQSVQAELLLPHEVESALDRRSVAYLPLGSIEYHAAHLPIGLDGLTAHGVCLRAAARTGGIVLPPLYYGVGGGHTEYPWTIMASSGAPLRSLLTASLSRLHAFGVRVAVLFSGHFAEEQLQLIRDAETWLGSDASPRVLALAVNQAGASIAPDHAGVFETTLLSAMWPDRVHLDQLQGTDPLYGVFGPDPRAFDPSRAADLLDEVVAWTIARVDTETEILR